MTEREIKALYRQIEGLNTDEIKALMDTEVRSLDVAFGKCARCGAFGPFGGLVGSGIGFMAGSVYSTLEKTCKKTWDQNKSRIQSIILNNPKSSKTIMDIVCLLAPTIAQQYTGFSGMAIVGTLTIICKQNLGL